MRFDRYTTPSVFTSLSVDNLVGSITNITNVDLTSVQGLSVINDPIIGLGVVSTNYVHTSSLTAVTLTASDVIYALGGNSNLWNSAYATITSLSSQWEESAEIIPTVTNYLSTSNVTVCALNITNFAVSSTTTPVILFTNETAGKVYHFDTTTTPSFTALFPGELTNGYNVSIVNAGLGSIFLSAATPLNASGSENSTPYSGMFIYKANNELFGVGVFV